MNNLLEQIRAELGPSVLLEGDAVQERFMADYSRENPVLPDVVLRPESTDELSQLLKLCNAAGQALVTQGGLTGLAGGATPRAGEWALSMERMNGIVELDTDAMTITVKAGTPLETVQNAAVEAGYMLPLDLGARGSCTIGGNVATNAGGNQVIQYGMTRALVLGLEAVMADGTIIASKNKLLKNNAGFDLKQLFIGTEGVLGVVSEVILRLFPATTSKQSALCALSSFEEVVGFFKSLKKQLGVITAFEVMWENYYRHAIEHVEYTRDAFDTKHDFYVLVETESTNTESDREHFQTVLFNEIECGRVTDSVLAKTLDDRNAFWAIRDAVGDFLNSIVNETNFDIGIPLGVMGECVREIEEQLGSRFDQISLLTFGHLGDGNMHLLASTGRYEDKQVIYDIVYGIIGKYEGSITAEHGIGMLKKEWLHLSRTEEEIKLMKTLKKTLDPKNILNPGRVV